MNKSVDNFPRSPGPVTSAVNQALIGSEHDRRVELLGKVVGDYRLVAIVGVGGAGTVYLGERADRAYSAQVAIKVVANTQLNQEAQRRFAAERQILANLNHPYIGRLLDAGETFFDEPFLVMEYVHGEAIDRYCDNQRLGVVERIQLFLKICDAVQYAHRNLIVHRDLKPGNILVSKEGIPKLLDFGIAKLLDDSAMAVLQDGVIAHTRVHDRLLTPEYASPEQIRGQPVTTTSDVYALGVILYELLTGTRPYVVNAHNQLELERSICIQDVIKPSQRVSLLEKESQSLSPTTDGENAKILLIPTARNTSFKKLTNQLQGDLDAIIQRALRKEPEKRYSSVEHLIDDLNRHLNKEPVEARQGNRWYYTQRFVRRHTVGVIAGTTALLSLIAVAVILSLQAQRLKEQRDIATQQRDKATQESQRAETVSNFMLDVFTAADPFQSQDKQVTAKELLDNAAKKIETTLNDQPEVKARLLEAIGKSYGNQDQANASIRSLDEAYRLQHQLSSQDPVRIASILTYLGRDYSTTGDFYKADSALSESRNMLTKSGHDQSAEYLQVLIDSGSLEQRLSRPVAAERYYEQGLKLSQQLHGSHHPVTANMLMQLAQISIWNANYVKAEKLAREAIDIYHATVPARHPDRIYAELTLADIFSSIGHLPEAITLITQGLADQKAVYGAASYRLISTYDSLAKVQMNLKLWDEAEQSARMELLIAKKKYGSTAFDTGISHSSVAIALLKHKNYIEAESEARISLQVLLTTSEPTSQYTASAEYLLAASLIGQHRPKEAEPILRQNIARWTRADAPAWRAARTESALGVALQQLKKPQEAKQALTHANEVLSAKDSGALLDEIAAAKERLDQYQHCVAKHHELDCQLSL